MPAAVLAPGRPGRPERAAAHLVGVRTVMPLNSYRLYWIERAKSPAEIQHADEQAARLVSAVSWLFRAIAWPARAARRPYPPSRDGASQLVKPAT